VYLQREYFEQARTNLHQRPTPIQTLGLLDLQSGSIRIAGCLDHLFRRGQGSLKINWPIAIPLKLNDRSEALLQSGCLGRLDLKRGCPEVPLSRNGDELLLLTSPIKNVAIGKSTQIASQW